MRTATLIAVLFGLSLATAAVNGEQSNVRLSASALSNRVYVDFAIAASEMSRLDARLLEVDPMIVNWEVDLRRNGRHWRDQSIRKVTLQVIVAPASQRGKCQASRQLDGRWIESRRVIDCAAAPTLLSSFNLPLFKLRAEDPGSYEVAIRGSVNARGFENAKTDVLARASVVRE